MTARRSVVVMILVLAAACTGGLNGPTPRPSIHTSSTPSAAAVSVLRIAAAPYRLRVPVQREVAVADGSTVYLAGGLDAAGNSAAGVFSLNPTTGKLTLLGSVPSAFHDAAGAFVGGRLLVFGGGSTSRRRTGRRRSPWADR